MKPINANLFELEESELSYHEKRAHLVLFWGTLRETALAENILSAMPKTKKVLDVGSGDGYFCWRASIEKRVFTIGIDLAKARLRNSRKSFSSFIGVQASVFHLPFKDNSFDVVVCSQLLEHLHSWRALQEILC